MTIPPPDGPEGQEPYDRATDVARSRVRWMLSKSNVPYGRTAVRDYINAAASGNLICLDCGSENHTQGSDWCNSKGLEHG